MLNTTIEISNYPLTEDYENQILDFIERVSSHSGIKVKVNATSTHITGEFGTVFTVLQQEIHSSYEKYGQMIFVIKVLKGALDLNYESK
ncbi:MAG: YkoF family thiamine/hydroxymethylpyrimidine-binding protein [Flavobacteriia bacterium]|jgi:uncharacterized protein YqgV (UPF0045/DUF77 family)